MLSSQIETMPLVVFAETYSNSTGCNIWNVGKYIISKFGSRWYQSPILSPLPLLLCKSCVFCISWWKTLHWPQKLLSREIQCPCAGGAESARVNTQITLLLTLVPWSKENSSNTGNTTTEIQQYGWWHLYISCKYNGMGGNKTDVFQMKSLWEKNKENTPLINRSRTLMINYFQVSVSSLAWW